MFLDYPHFPFQFYCSDLEYVYVGTIYILYWQRLSFPCGQQMSLIRKHGLFNNYYFFNQIYYFVISKLCPKFNFYFTVKEFFSMSNLELFFVP